MLDRDGRYRLVNRRLAAVDHVSADDHLGRRPADVHAGAVDSDCVKAVLRTGSPVAATRAIPDAEHRPESLLPHERPPGTRSHGPRHRGRRDGARCHRPRGPQATRRATPALLRSDRRRHVDRHAGTSDRPVRLSDVPCPMRRRRGPTAGICGSSPCRASRPTCATMDARRLRAQRPATDDSRGAVSGQRCEIPSLAAAAGYPALDAERGETGDASVIAIPLRDPTGELAPVAVLRVSWPYPFQLEPAGWTTLETLVSLSELTLGGSRMPVSRRWSSRNAWPRRPRCSPSAGASPSSSCSAHRFRRSFRWSTVSAWPRLTTGDDVHRCGR